MGPQRGASGAPEPTSPPGASGAPGPVYRQPGGRLLRHPVRRQPGAHERRRLPQPGDHRGPERAGLRPADRVRHDAVRHLADDAYRRLRRAVEPVAHPDSGDQRGTRPDHPDLGAKAAVAELGNARLLKVNGDGHTSMFVEPSVCRDDAELAYLVSAAAASQGHHMQRRSAPLWPEPRALTHPYAALARQRDRASDRRPELLDSVFTAERGISIGYPLTRISLDALTYPVQT